MSLSHAYKSQRKKNGWVHIKLEKGVWYAYGTGPKWGRNLLLVPAINFCKRLNAKRGKK